MIYPISTPKPLGFRQKTDSQQLNQLHQDTLQDLLTLCNQANTLEKDMTYVKEVLSTENTFLRYRLNELEGQLVTLEQKLAEQKEGEELLVYPLFSSNFQTSDELNPASVDLTYLSTTRLPMKITSKVSVYDETLQTTYLPPSLKLTYGPETSTIGKQIIQIEDNGAENALNGDPNTYWVRQYVCDASCHAVYCELIITLPEDALTTRNINTIKLLPYPVHALDVLSIEYRENGNWIPIPSFNEHHHNLSDRLELKETVTAITKSPNLQFNFKRIQANEIRIRLRQEHYIKREDGTKEMMIGLKQLEINQETYSHDYHGFSADLTFPYPNRQIIVKGLEIVLNNPSEADSDLIQYEFYTYDSLGYLSKLSESLPFTLGSTKLHIKFKMLEQQATPNIHRINVLYSLK